MEDLKELLVLAAEKGIAVPTDTKALLLYPVDAPAMSFKEFIAHKRIRPFIQLHILAAMEGKAIVGHTTLKAFLHTYDEGEAPDQEIAAYGPTILDQTFTVDEVFQSVLAGFGFAQIDATNRLDARIPRKNIQGELPKFPGDAYTTEEGEIYLLDNLILTPDTVYVATQELQEQVRDILSHHYNEFELLLQRHNDIGIPHEIYLELLLKWFPGKVRVRRLPTVDS